MGYKIHKYNIQTRCPVCNGLIFMDSNGNGEKCPNCSWVKSTIHEEFPDRVICPNLISLNKAKQLYRTGKPFTPDFNDFIEGFNFYGEMEFTYKETVYCLMAVQDIGLEFWGINTSLYETFKDIEEFKQKAQIDNKLVKNIWNEVKNAHWLQ